MDQGSQEQEKQPISPSAFHVGENSAKKTFEKLYPQGVPNRVELDNEKGKLKEFNPNLEEFVNEFLGLEENGLPREGASQKFRESAALGYDGFLIAHRALQEEAQARRGVLPKFSKEGFEDYEEDVEENLIKVSDAGEYSNRDDGGLKIRRSRLSMFRMNNSQFSKVIEKNFGTIQDWKPEDDPRYQAIIELSLAVGLGSKAPREIQQ